MEIQDERPKVEIPLECVGFKGIRKRIIVDSGNGITLVASIDVCVSLPSNQRGAHLSRNYYAILEAVEKTEKARSIEYYLSKIAGKLLELHPYAGRAVVAARTSYFVKPDLTRIPVREEPVDVQVSVVKTKGWERWTVSVSVYGMTACPSAQRTISQRVGIRTGLLPTHSQKARLTLTVETGPGPIVRIEELARIAFSAFSAPALSFLKRTDEAELVIMAYNNAKLAEDVVRDAILGAARLLYRHGLGEDSIITAEIDSYESIHPQNVYARARVKLGDLALFLGRPDRNLD